MKDNKLVAAQIGCGAFARSQHLPNITARKDLYLKYCCDADLSSARSAALLAKLAIESIRLKRALPVLQEEWMPGIM